MSVEEVGRRSALNSTPRDMPRQPGLLREGAHAAERRDLVLGERNPPVDELVDERSPPPQTRKLQVEPGAIEQSPERHELVLCAAAHQGRHDVQHACGRHGSTAAGMRPRAISARTVFLSATASPAMLKK